MKIVVVCLIPHSLFPIKANFFGHLSFQSSSSSSQPAETSEQLSSFTSEQLMKQASREPFKAGSVFVNPISFSLVYPFGSNTQYSLMCFLGAFGHLPGV